MQCKLRGGTGEEADAKILEDLALHCILAHHRAVHMGSIGLIADHQTLGGHDLQHFQDRGVSGGAFLVESFVDFPNCCRFLVPQNP